MARAGRSDRAVLCPQTRPHPPPPAYRNFGLKVTLSCVSPSLLDKQHPGLVSRIQGLLQGDPQSCLVRREVGWSQSSVSTRSWLVTE